MHRIGRIALSLFCLVPLLAPNARAQTCLGATEVYSYGFENGISGWTQVGTQLSWVLTNDRAQSGNVSAFTPDAASTGDEAMFSPSITVPAGPTQLRFWQWQTIDAARHLCQR